MTTPSLSSDDLPSSQADPLDEVLRQQLEASTARYFYEACDGVTQSVLLSCQWYITTSASALTLVITGLRPAVYLRVINNLVLIGNQLAQFSSRAKVRICPPNDSKPFLEMRVDEISMHRDLL